MWNGEMIALSLGYVNRLSADSNQTRSTAIHPPQPITRHPLQLLFTPLRPRADPQRT